MVATVVMFLKKVSDVHAKFSCFLICKPSALFILQLMKLIKGKHGFTARLYNFSYSVHFMSLKLTLVFIL